MSFIYIRENQLIQKVIIESINYIVSDGNYCNVVGTSTIRTKISLSKIYELLPENKFIRIHKRHIINLDLIDGICLPKMEIYIGEFVLPIGPAFKQSFLKRINII